MTQGRKREQKPLMLRELEGDREGLNDSRKEERTETADDRVAGIRIPVSQ